MKQSNEMVPLTEKRSEQRMFNGTDCFRPVFFTYELRITLKRVIIFQSIVN